MARTAAAAFRFRIALQIHQAFIAFLQEFAEPVFKRQRARRTARIKAVMLAEFMFLPKIAFRTEFFLFRRRLGLFDRQGDFSLIVYRQHFDVDLVSNFQKIIYIFDILISDFRNMYKTYFLSGSSTNAPNFVIPVTVPSITLPTSIVMLF